MNPLRKADHIADHLLRRIVSGELPVGTVLPREAELAAAYGANRSVLREAIKQLEVHRLVRPVRRRGTVVLDPLRSLTPEVLRAMLMPDGQQVDTAVLASFLEVRAQLDVQMNALAAQRRTTQDLAALANVVERMQAARVSPQRYAEVTEELSFALARATHNPIFEMLVHWQRHIARDLEGLFALVRFPSDAHLQGVRALCDAVRAHDVETARDLASAFHAFATPVMLQAIAQQAPRAEAAAAAKSPSQRRATEPPRSRVRPSSGRVAKTRAPRTPTTEGTRTPARRPPPRSRAKRR